MDPEKIKIPVPMRDARRIYAALESLKRIAANEGNDEFVQTLNELMDRLKDYHNTVVSEWGAGQDDLIKGSEEDRRAPPSQEPQHDALQPGLGGSPRTFLLGSWMNKPTWSVMVYRLRSVVP